MIARRREILALLLILAPFVVLRVMKDAGAGPYGLDASLYVHLARHVERGDGYVSTISLYHLGQELPVRSTIQPLWPLLMGYTARLIGLLTAATLLPRLFYLAALALLHALVRRISTVAYAPVAVVALLAANPIFFSSTTHPYREGAAYVCGFAALLLVERSPLAAGALTGLAFLARIEFGAVGVACILAMLLRRAPIRTVAIYAAAALAFVIPWIAWLGYVPGVPALGSWVARPTASLPPVPAPHFEGVERLRDLAAGAAVAFRLGNPDSYTREWGVAALLVPVAVLLVLVEWIRTRARPLAGAGTAKLATAFTALMLFTAVFVFRGGEFKHFMFGWRHGITLVFSLALAVPYLLSHRAFVVRAVAVGAVALSLLMGFLEILRFSREPNMTYTPAERALLRALPPKTKVLTTRANTLGMLSDAYFHGTYCYATPETTRAFVSKVRVDEVVVYDFERRCAFTQGLGDLLEVHAAFGEGPQRIWLLRPKAKGATRSSPQ